MVRIVAVGDNVVDCYEGLGQMFPGGNALNVSVFASRAGARTAYVGAVGTDAAGRTIRDALIDEGVDVSHLRSLDGGDTAYCIIGHRGGDRVFLESHLGVSRFELAVRDLEFIARHDAAHVSQSSGLDDHVEQLARVARLSYDFSTRHDETHLDAVSPHCFLASFSGGDLSPDEAAGLAARAGAAGATWVLVTRGSGGALLTHGGITESVEAIPGVVVDTLGAGDAFIARTLVGLVSGEDPKAALADAAVRAAETCTRTGAFGHAAALSIAPPTPNTEPS